MVADRFSGACIAPVMENTTPAPEDRPADQWPIAAYQHIADDGIGAEKLAASAVAPLVAAARGYESVSRAGLKDAASRFRVDRRPSRIAVGVLQPGSYKFKVDVAIDQAQQMIFRNLIFQAEVIEQRFSAGLVPHHEQQASKWNGENQHRELWPAYNPNIAPPQASTEGLFQQTQAISLIEGF